MSRLRFPALLLALVLLQGCQSSRPTLRASCFRQLPSPDPLVETHIWERTESLIVPVVSKIGTRRETRYVDVRAAHDTRVLSILVRWDDFDGSLEPLKYYWDREADRYIEVVNAVDRCALLWPLEPAVPSFCMLEGGAAVYDAWQWKAQWHTPTGYADDLRLFVQPHPPGTSPRDVEGRLYPRLDAEGFMEIRWQQDSGRAAIVTRPKPERYSYMEISGALLQDAQGSAADVRAYGLYNPKSPERAGNWFVEFQRLQITGSKEEDYQFEGLGPFMFAIAIHDNDAGGAHFTSGPIKLYLEPSQLR